MKKIVLLLISFYSVAVMGQNLIAPITISLPANPPANTANWATAMPAFMITAQSKLRNGQVPGEVIESRVLVTIKNGGSKICGSYTQQTAPRSNFNTVTKNWNGGAALTLLGQDCTLPPGTYELCVQFYNLNPAAGNGVLGEACKTFTIADAKPQSYSPPQNIIPVNGKVFTQQEANLPITLRWTPVLPKPKADVNYKVRIIEVLPGQNKAAAIRNSAPVEVLEVKNLTQANSKLSKRCNGCEYVWNVEASKTPAQGDIEMLGTSEATDFSVKGDIKNDTTNQVPSKYSPPQNVTPADGKVFTKEEAKQPIAFRWTPVLPRPKEDVIYKIRLFEIRPGQSKIQALKENQPIEQAAIKNATQTTFKLAQRSNGLGYVWNVEASKKSAMGDIEMLGTSEATSFMMTSFDCNYNFTIRITDSICLGNVNGMDKYRICFNSNFTSTTNDLKFLNTGSGIKAYLPVSPFTVYTITSMPTLVPQLHGGSNPVQNYCIEVLVPSGVNTIRISLQGDDNDPDPNNICSPGATTDVKLPSCICDYCQKAVEFDNDPGTTTISGNSLNIVQPIWDMAGNTIVSVKAEIVSFERYVGDSCMNCNKDAALWGNFTSGTLGALTGTFGLATSPVSGNTHHTLYWNPPTGYTGALNPFKLNINTPPLSNLTCCCEKIKTKIRYTYTFKDKATGECKTCNGGIFEYEAQKGTCPASTTSTGGGIKQN